MSDLTKFLLYAFVATSFEILFAVLWLRTLAELHRVEAERDEFWDELNSQ